MNCVICFEDKPCTQQRCICHESTLCNQCFVKLCDQIFFDDDFKIQCPICRSHIKVPQDIHTDDVVLFYISKEIVAKNKVSQMASILEKYPAYRTRRCTCGCDQTLVDTAANGTHINPDLVEMVSVLKYPMETG